MLIIYSRTWKSASPFPTRERVPFLALAPLSPARMKKGSPSPYITLGRSATVDRLPPGGKNRNYTSLPPGGKYRNYTSVPPGGKYRNYTSLPPGGKYRNYTSLPPGGKYRNYTSLPPGGKYRNYTPLHIIASWIKSEGIAW